MIKFVLAAAALLASNAMATPITGINGTGPIVPDATAKIGFENQSNSLFSALTIGDVTFTGVGGNWRTTNQFAGMFSTRGSRLLDNNAGLTNAIRFDFAATVNAFAFSFGASDVNWTLSAYTASGSLIESLTIAPVRSANDGRYFGLADADIAYAVLSAGSGDYVMLDNFTYALQPKPVPATKVPEPASLGLLGAGLAGLLAARRRKIKPAA